jgi:ABC-2 type transport system permease protein
MALAGTDIAHHRSFVASAETYRRDIQRLMNGDITRNSRAGIVYTAGSDLWSRVPEFRYESPGLPSVLGQQRWNLLVLGAWVVAAWWFAVRSVARLAAD